MFLSFTYTINFKEDIFNSKFIHITPRKTNKKPLFGERDCLSFLDFSFFFTVGNDGFPGGSDGEESTC